MGHTQPETLSDDEAKDFGDFLFLFCKHLPCPTCRRHCHRYLETHMTEEKLQSRDAIVCFLNDLHNDVNKRTHKQEYTLREHYEFMTGKYAKRTKDIDDSLITSMLVVVFAVLLVKVMAKHFGKRDQILNVRKSFL